MNKSNISLGLGNISAIFANIRQSSAMNPLLWILSIISLVFVISFALSGIPIWIMYLTAASFGICLLVVLIVVLYFAFKAPNNLRSDKYQTQYDRLIFLERSQTHPEIEQEISTISTNPSLKEDK